MVRGAETHVEGVQDDNLTDLAAALTYYGVLAIFPMLIDDQEVPNPKDRNVRFGKLAVALTVEGALFRLVKGLVEHGSRQGFARLTGTWPGQEEPQSE